MVQILTHTREKLVFVEKMKQELAVENKSLDQVIQGYRDEINNSKLHC